MSIPTAEEMRQISTLSLDTMIQDIVQKIHTAALNHKKSISWNPTPEQLRQGRALDRLFTGKGYKVNWGSNQYDSWFQISWD